MSNTYKQFDKLISYVKDNEINFDTSYIVAFGTRVTLVFVILNS